MPIYSEDDDKTIAAPPSEVNDVSTVETVTPVKPFNSVQKIAAFAEGKNLVTNYYSQYQGADDTSSADTDIDDPTLKQYQKVENMILKISDNPTPSVDGVSGLSTIRGSAVVMPGIVPNVNDVFIAELGDDNYGLFTIYEAPEPKSVFKDKLYEVQYSLVEYVTATSLALLESKVVNVLVYDPKISTTNNGPLFSKSDYEQMIDVKKITCNLIDDFYCEFYDYDRKTLIYEQDLNYIHDYYLTDFFVGYFDLPSHNKRPQTFNLHGAIFKSPYRTVIDAFIERSPSMLKRCVTKMCKVNTNYATTGLIWNTLTCTNIDYVLQPDKVNNLNNPVAADEAVPYIFSEDFYNDTVNKTTFEKMVHDFISGIDPEFSDVKGLLDGLSSLTPEERFQRTLFLLVLLRNTQI